MNERSRLSSVVLIIIGIIAGALIFSQIHENTQPVVYSSPAAPADSIHPADRPLMSLRDFNRAFVEIAKAVNPTVVTVFTEKVYKVRGFGGYPFFGSPFEDFFKDFFGNVPKNRTPQDEEYIQRGLGSGVIVSKDGYILTNNHVIDGADTIYVRLIDDRTLPAKVIGADAKTDIAVLKVDADNLPVIKLGDSDKLQVGEWVLAIGSPLSPNLAHTVTSGIVSAKGRSQVGLADYEDFIQTDAAINPGNSGGALINLDGELVGINTAIATRTGGFQGIGFAVPINMARSVMESILKYGKVIRGWLGVYIQDVNQNLAKALKLKVKEGVLIADVVEDSPADKAGIKEGDVVIKLNGKPVTNSAQLRNEIAATRPGTKVKLTVLRDGDEKTITVELGTLEPEKVSPESQEKVQKLLGIQVEPLTSELAQQYGLKSSLKGVVVTTINPNSNAARAGLREGDLIMQVNKKDIESMQDFLDAIKDVKRGDTILFKVMRRKNSFFIAFTL
ncbi:MAG: DegQ family serine endoprotease [Calditrichaeota bacterium]|nr:MAG: DegQ family serine endoprotease [Calditrichota bacterium]